MSTHQNGLSVYGSGLWVGFKNGETLVINRSGEYVLGGSTVINSSGYVANGRLTHGDGTVGLILAGGEVSGSGWALYRSSTGLSTIKHLTASIKRASTGAWDYTSGQATTVDTAYSGGTFDLFPRYQVQSLSSVITSAGTSNVISWTALGT
jgi:hypothetical protein